MNLLKDLPTFDEDSNGAGIRTVRVVIEVPKGTLHKYEYHPMGYMTIVRDLNEKYHYPYNYGMIPQTLGGDNDPLDAIVISDEPIVSGTVVNCNVLGIIKTVDNGEIDDKLLCVPYFIKEGSINLEEVLKYLNEYKYPYQDGTEILDVSGPTEAYEILVEAVENYKRSEK